MKTLLIQLIIFMFSGLSFADQLKQSFRQTDLDSGLVAYFPFNGNANDETGNGYDGTINGNATLVPDRFSSENKAFTFPDQFSNISLANSTNLNLETGFTINAWIKYKNAYSVIVGKHICGYVNGFIFGIDYSGQLALWVANSAIWSSLHTNDSFNENQWYMVTAIYEAGTATAKIYVNGENKGTGNVIYNNFSSYPISIGEVFLNNCSAANMSGAVDEVKIYNRALSDADILAEYNASRNGLVAFYPFTGNANDESGNNNNLINNGANLTTDRFGQESSAYYFSGSSNLSRIDNDLLDLTENFSVSFWINRPGSIEYTFVMSKHLSGDDFTGSWGVASYAGGNTITFTGTPNWGSGSNPITGVVPENEWHHITFTYDKSTAEWKSFLDGTLSNSGTQAFNIQNTDKDFMIGACMPNVSNITAALDDIRIYNRVIDSSEVLALYNDSTTYFPPLEEGLVAYWPFSNNVNDTSGNNNNGINYNATFSIDRYSNDSSTISFNGSDSYVEGLNPGNNLPVNDSPRTISCWVKSFEASGSRNIFHYGTAEVAPTNYHLFMQEGKYVGVGNGYGFGILISDKNLHGAEWNFITTVYEGSSTNMQHIFINGKLDTSAVFSDTPNTILGSNWRMGRFMGGSPSLNGTIDDLKVYNIALSEQQIWENYKSTTTAPDLLFPVNGASIGSLTPVLDWDSTVTVYQYVLLLSPDSTFASYILDSDVYESSYYVLPGLLQENIKYFWKVRGISSGGMSPWSEVSSFQTILTNIEDEQQLPTEFALLQNYPNPFNPSTFISYQLPVSGKVELKIFDLLGNEVGTLVNEIQTAGNYEVKFEGTNLTSGVYFYQLKTGRFIETKKLMLLK